MTQAKIKVALINNHIALIFEAYDNLTRRPQVQAMELPDEAAREIADQIYELLEGR